MNERMTIQPGEYLGNRVQIQFNDLITVLREGDIWIGTIVSEFDSMMIRKYFRFRMDTAVSLDVIS